MRGPPQKIQHLSGGVPAMYIKPTRDKSLTPHLTRDLFSLAHSMSSVRFKLMTSLKPRL